jgi:hypothetical protein
LSLLHAHVLPHAPSEQASLGVKKNPLRRPFLQWPVLGSNQ